MWELPGWVETFELKDGFAFVPIRFNDFLSKTCLVDWTKNSNSRLVLEGIKKKKVTSTQVKLLGGVMSGEGRGNV
jgi:hypothetical protein